ncbi:MAG: hypothetical protein KGJ02_05270 [Verrucomicrobiota bacterium]|nr:hypothetical protein [Verrucomicrobiota bacterium]
MKAKKIFLEIKKQLMNIPSFALNAETGEMLAEDHLEYVNKQIEAAIEQATERMVFLIGPFGSGKTTQLKYFFRQYPNLNYTYRSFVHVNSFDFALLHLANYWSRLFFLGLGVGLGVLAMKLFPVLSPLPFLLILSGFFAKTFANLIYIFHETVDNLFRRKPKIVVIEDLERSPLSPADQWSFLSNLWQYKRIYLITLGYPSVEKDKALKLIESAIKLGGTVIELPPNEKLNYEMIRKLDPAFPFQQMKKDKLENKGWMSMFTLREMLLLREQAILRSEHAPSEEMRQLKYVEVAFQLLLGKLGLAKGEITFVEETRKIKGYTGKKLSSDETHYLESFIQSIRSELGIQTG